ncbi:transforming acidic coiled-coil-containing protein 3-like [Denticeps clupeoides]|uniref:transforming acidic coiled-coil-containing protein 3-like n=1 Tax=Denticeps clupeoides TaxID=299321 RepID=UPI0010A322B5|nr:transforming acidic coiled-coil-containing protein 3-like [Denticeps clupeoides]
MSSVLANDENQGFSPGPEPGCDLFAVEQPTGRPSILRQSQFENIANKTVPKGVKVCFQTPRRDPVSKKILSPVKKMSVLEDCTRALESLKLAEESSGPHGGGNVLVTQSSSDSGGCPDVEEPIQTRGIYQLDLANLETCNPFQSSTKMGFSPVKSYVQDPPELTMGSIGQSEPKNVFGKNSEGDSALDDTLPFIPSVENSVTDASVNVSSTDSTVVIEMKNPQVILSEPQVPEEPSTVEPAEPTLSARGSYSFDFDNLDSVNPFNTGGSKLQNSPSLSRKSESPKAPNSSPEVSQEAPVLTAPQCSSQTSPPQTGPVVLEFNFDDCVKRKPPPKRLGKRPPTVPEKKLPSPLNQLVSEDAPPTETPPTMESHTSDVDKLDNPNVCPFGSKSEVVCSPPGGCLVSADQTSTEHAQNLPRNSASHVEEPAAVKLAEETQPEVELPIPEISSRPAQPSLPQPDEFRSAPQAHSATAGVEEEEFVPGTMFMPPDFDEQMDYLEQFGSSTFKESALRKQSLYLKFDPLLRESPKKTTAAASGVGVANLPRLSLFARMEPQKLLLLPPPADVRRDSGGLPLLGDVPEPAGLDVLESTFKQPLGTEDAIIELLKYSQRDMDAALAKAQEEGQQREEEWRLKYEELQQKNREMGTVVSEFEMFISGITEAHQAERGAAQEQLAAALEEVRKLQEELQVAQQEKQQALTDISSMERSFFDLVKRLDKYKEVIEGFKKNEETLKACAQDYMARIKKEEQRYQSVKAHAEEKINLANVEIAGVRAEVAGLQAQLKRDEVKRQSLEKNLEQKVREVEELTKLCDELIAKFQK